MAACFTKVFLGEVLLSNNGRIPLTAAAALLKSRTPNEKAVIRCYSKQRSPLPELFPQRLILPENHGYVPILTRHQINTLLSTQESRRKSRNEGKHVVKSFHSNELASNSPMEDRRGQAKLLETEGLLYAVYDGHGGCACSQAIKERLFSYIAISLLPINRLEDLNHAMKTDTPFELFEWHYNPTCYTHEEMSDVHRTSLHKFIVESLSMQEFEDEFEGKDRISHALRTAFMRLDFDISTEALPLSGAINMESLEVALSGACAIVAHINGLNLHVANLGDTRAVLGQLDGKTWTAKTLTTDHNTSNNNEIMRVRSEHPTDERNVIKNNRLLGQLIPLRAFGDMRYKWSLNDLKNIVSILDTPYAHTIIPSNYYTPPYLSCTPEITHHKLTQKDKFLVIGSDGLWEQLSDQKVIEYVGAFLEGKETDEHFRVTEPMKLGEINKQLERRKFGLANKSEDANASTHLIRHSLGHEHQKVSEMLTLPAEVVRYYRDDITITVLFFDTEYILKLSKES